MKLGIAILLEKKMELLKGKRIGILAHAASVDAKGAHTIDRIVGSRLGKVRALFGPEHGLTTHAQDMESVDTAADPNTGVPIYSLYGSTLDSLKPTQEMLKNIDVLVCDLQDIGSRYYTYVWTACLCAEACKEFGKKMIICDRPNPINGETVEGGEIEEGFESFVGLHSIPVRHAMTIGEIVSLVNRREKIGADITVVKMQGWRRSWSWGDTKLPWTNPSPNMRSYTAALLYPGMCLVEATNISEGRGTDTPFEIVGAPYMDTEKFIKEFRKLKLEGVIAAPTAFIPTRQKWAGSFCNGVRWTITDGKKFRPYLTGLAFLWLMNRMYKGKGFEWRTAPYEFVISRPAIDLLTGSAFFRENIDKLKLDDLKDFAKTKAALRKERLRCLFYA